MRRLLLVHWEVPLIIMFVVATRTCVAFSGLATGRMSSRIGPPLAIGRLYHASSNHQESSSPFLDQVETSVARVLDKYDNIGGSSSSSSNNNIISIEDLPPHERESLGVARNLNTRLRALARNNDCRRCWLQQAHCVCDQCPPLERKGGATVLPKVNRLFLLTHHKEICLVVDTAKLILAAFPETCRLVVGGISSEYQDSMKELEEAIERNNCLVLFPSDNARTFDEIEREATPLAANDDENEHGWDLIVIDGTWAQARKLHSRYVQSIAGHVQLSDTAVATLAQSASEETREGHQLRRHPIKWKEVSTLEATRLFLGDMMTSSEERPWDTLATYQQTGDAAARKQLGPRRESSKERFL